MDHVSIDPTRRDSPTAGVPGVAFKEWAVICRGLAAGRQDVILRKGGIVEPGGRFRVEHESFLLLPTFLHQDRSQLVPEAADLFTAIDDDRPPVGTAVFRLQARVREVHEVRSLAGLAAFRRRHLWTDAVVAERFHRWQDLLHVLVVEVAPLPMPLVVPWRAEFDGCKSWVAIPPPT